MKKFFRIFGIVAVVAVLFAAIIASTTYKPSARESVWDEAMTIGNLDAKNHFIVYSDLVCPYCIAFENAIVENEEEFQAYIKENDILYEVRLSDFLYEYGEAKAPSSRYSALASYCAKDHGRFWDYYNQAVSGVWNDYFKSLGKSAFTSLNAAGKDYWIGLGEQIGLGDDFKDCVKNEKPLAEIKENAAKTAKFASGMPYFKFNSYSPPGFHPSGTWEDVKAYFKEGLRS